MNQVAKRLLRLLVEVEVVLGLGVTGASAVSG